MNKIAFAMVAAASVALAACSGADDDSLNNVETYDNASDLNALATDAANDAEAEALGNQAQQLNEEGNAAAVDELNASGNTDGEDNVAGM